MAFGGVSVVMRSADPATAIEFLEKAFGFEKGMAHEEDGTIVHAEMWAGDCCVMLGSVNADITPSYSSIVVDDPDGLHDRAAAAGAEITMGLTEQSYGSRDFQAKDPDGNIWHFGTYVPVKP